MSVDDRMRQMSGQWFHALGISQEDFAANPYAVYRRWQDQGSVREIAPGRWMVLGYEQVRTALTDPRFIKSTPPSYPIPESYQHLPEMAPSMLVVNPPAHTRLRSLVTRAFQPRHLERLRPFISALAEDLLDEMSRQSSSDLVEDYALPLPALVIAELLGVPLEDRPLFRGLSQKIALMVDPTQSADVRKAGATARWELLDYFHTLVQRKQDGPADDLLSDLAAGGDHEGSSLTAGELLTMALLLLVAGHETTANLISLGAYRIFSTPDALYELRGHQASYSDAVEECLRLESPVQLDGRMAQDDTVLGSTLIPQGASVTLVLAQANRDPAVFASPDSFDIHRNPNPHLAFGRGIHMCLGSSLARMEGAIALEHLFSRRVQVAGPALYQPNVLLRGLRRLPVKIS